MSDLVPLARRELYDRIAEAESKLQAIADAHESVKLWHDTGDSQAEAIAIEQRAALLDALTQENTHPTLRGKAYGSA
jgi:hypothetical protein